MKCGCEITNLPLQPFVNARACKYQKLLTEFDQLQINNKKLRVVLEYIRDTAPLIVTAKLERMVDGALRAQQD